MIAHLQVLGPDVKTVAIEFGWWAASNGGLEQDRLDVLALDRGPLSRSWLHCAHSEVSARTGAPAQSVLDLAVAHAATDAEHGMDFAEQAFDQLERPPYGTAYGGIPAVRRALEGTPQARMMDERMRSLPAAG